MSSHLETNFDSGNSEISFIAGYEMEPDQDLSLAVYHHRDNTRPRVNLAMTKLLLLNADDSLADEKGERDAKGEVKAVF